MFGLNESAESANAAPALPLSVRALTRQYGQRKILRDISFDIRPGEIVGLLGPNGAGKTTLLETIEGIQTPTLGEVRVFGQLPRSLRSDVRAKVGFVFQRNSLPDHVTVWQLVSLYTSIFGKNEHQQTLLMTLGLGHLLTRFVGELSVGQRQRLSVFSALIASPTLVVMDEPTSALDLRSRRAVWEVIQNAKLTRSLSGLIATHDMEEAEALCDKVIFIDEGVLRGSVPLRAERNTRPTLSIRFEAPAEFVRDCLTFKAFAMTFDENSQTYQIDCPKDMLPEIIGVLVEGERSKGFDSKLAVGQHALESAYLSHVATAE